MSEQFVNYTLLNGERAEIWRRDITHVLGKMNNCPDDLWVKRSIRYSGDPHVHDVWIPWIDIGARRVCWGVRIQENNSTKEKWNDTQINGNCSAILTCNGQDVFEIGCSKIEYALVKAASLIVELSEHPFNFANPQEEIGRKIYFHRQPAIITRLIMDQGAVIIKPDGIEQFDLNEPWDDDFLRGWHEEYKFECKTTITDPNIYWFRSDN